MSWAYAWLRRENLSAIQSDKSGGYVLVKNADVKTLLNEKLETRQYLEVYDITDDSRAAAARVTTSSIKRLEKAYNIEGFERHYTADIRGANWSKFTSRVLATIKDHKPSGNVCFRVLHSGAGHPMTNLERFLATQIKPFLTALPFLYFSGDSFVAALRAKSFPCNSRFMKIDVKDFFNKGSPDELSRNGFRHLEDINQREACTATVKELLWHQYVHSSVVGRSFLVQTGSGQGRVLSSDLADKNFFHLAEEGHVTDSNLENCNIYFYGRYRDDILIVFTSEAPSVVESPAGGFYQRLVTRSRGTYDLTIEIHSATVQFLDLVIYKGCDFNATGKLSYRPHVRKSTQRMYLSSDSCHSPSVLSTWPLGEADRLWRRSSTMRAYREARDTFVNRLLASRTGQIDEVKVLKPYSQCMLSGRHRPDAKRALWLILPYHPAIPYRKLRKAASLVVERWFNPLRQIFGSEVVVKIGCRNLFHSCATKLRKQANV